MNPPDSQPKQLKRPARKPRRWLPWLGAVALVAIIIAGFWPRPIPVEAAPVVTGLLRTTVNEEGKTRIRQRYTISAPVTGQLRRIPYIAGGDIPSTQTVVAVIEPAASALLDKRSRQLAEAARDTAAAQVEHARGAQQFADSEVRRNQSLFEGKAVSARDMEQFQWLATAAAHDLAAAQAALRQADAQLIEFEEAGVTTNSTAIELHSPTAGKVLTVYEPSARTVAAGTPLLQIGDPTDLDVIIEVLSRDGAIIQPGTPVELDQWGGPEPLQARVRYVEPAAFTKVSALGVEEQRVYVVADLLTPPSQRGNLGDNFRAEASIITWQNEHALKAPSGALFRNGQQWSAYVLADGRAQLRPVKVGRSSGIETEILEGLKEGDQVILYPGDRVKDGERVNLVKL
jgi:HlyD family secretion protein